MAHPKITRREIIKSAAAVGALGAVGFPSAVFADGGGKRRIRWDLIDIVAPTPGTRGEIRAGGEDTASSAKDTKLNLFGSGTFRPGHPREVTGGGTWTSDNPVVGVSGTYRVTELISWVRAPGTLAGAPFNDHIGNLADTRAGLAVLRIKYSDGSDGVLVLSCNLNGTPQSVDEGINASKGFVNFFMPAEATFGNHSNRTAFHALGEEEGD